MTAIPPVSPQPTPASLGQTAAPAGGTGAAGDLGDSFTGALDSVTSALTEADSLAQQAATGQLQDISQLTTATAKAELAMELTVAFRDRAVQSFQQIMQMQV